MFLKAAWSCRFEALEDQSVFVFQEPCKGFAFLDFQGLGQGDGQVDVIAAIGRALDLLDFDGVTHGLGGCQMSRWRNKP